MNKTYPHISVFFLALAAIIAIVWPSLAEMESLWRRSETFMHCYLIIPIFAWLLWRRWPYLETKELTFSPIAAVAAVFCLTAWLSAYLVEVSFIAHFSIIAFLQCLVWACFGKKFVLSIRFPMLYLYFLVPFGEAINPFLQDITAYLTVGLLNGVAIPVFREGLYLHTAFGLFEVAVACSGLNFLIAALSLACLYAYLTYSSLLKQVSFVIIVIILSILANSLRAFLLIYIAKVSDFNYGFGDDHYYYGWAVFFLVIFTNFWLGGYFADKTPSVNQTYSPKADKYKPFNRMIAGITVSILAVSLFSSALIRFNLPLTEVITAAQPSPQILLSRQQNPSDWGITFNDGLYRDFLVLENSVEILHASYASRQDQGEMINWRNRLFDRDGWTIVRRTAIGTGWRNQAELLFLRDNRGRSRTVLYTYRIGKLNLIRPELVKIAQLLDLLSIQQGASVLAFSISDVSDDEATDILQQSYLLLSCLPESCKS
ncbi:exosortase A [Rheinheimera sp. UJ63]|uniref:exosortase A n=1 Tax=Rheinheimera sp. UJ63 TaxID=2910157 RepID=UPI001F3960F2|nr:exosortase A [Rheinheimera sp. UJ63]MCF4007790.1 exosortase [Rheinheimera sp. UJ63]